MSYGDYKIVRSRAQCMSCFDIIESKHRHDFVSCKCGKIFLDGGKDYVRYGAPTLTAADITLLTDYATGNPKQERQQR